MENGKKQNVYVPVSAKLEERCMMSMTTS